MNYIGDIALAQTIDQKFCTVQATGAPTTLAGSPVISNYVGNNTTQLTAGITLTVDFDGVTGLNNVRVVATGGNGYAAQTDNQLVITTGTVNSVTAVGYVVGSYSIENRSSLRPTTAGRTLDVASTGEAGLDFGNVTFPVGVIPIAQIVDNGTLQSATGTTAVLRSAASFADDRLKGMTIVITGGTGVGQSRIITGYVNSTDTATVDTWTTTPDNTSTYIVYPTPPASATLVPPVNSTQFAGQTITAAAGVTIPSSIASPTNITAGVITTTTNLTNAPPDSAGVTTLLSRLPAAFFSGITSLAQWLGMLAGKQAANSTAQTEIRATGAGSGTFDATTDSAEALRDNLATATALAAVSSAIGALNNLSSAQAQTAAAAALAAFGSFGVKKNTAKANFPFLMTDATTHAPKTGLTVAAQRALDGAAFADCANAVSEIGSGWYKLSLATTDLNGDTVALKFTATGADPLNIALVTSP